MTWVCNSCTTTNDESSMKCANCGQIRKIKCRALGCPSFYNITEPRCPLCGESNQFYVSKMTKPGLTTACPRCGHILDNKVTANCPKCNESNPGYILKPGEMFCQYCKKLISVNDKTCPKCNKPNKAYQPTKSLGEATAKRVSGRLYEILMYIIAGIAVMFVPSFFGLPSFRFLGIALMAFMPFYIMLPSESDVRRSMKTGEVEIPSGKVGLLVTKAMVKILIFFFVAYFELYPLNRLIALAFTFFFYFTMPVSYKESQPYRLIESWARPFAVGTYLSFLIFMVFVGSGGIGNAGPGTSLLFMSIAFFVWSFPTHKEEREEGVMKLVVSTKLKDLSHSSGFIAIERYIFFFFMFMALGMSGLNFQNIFSTSGTSELTFLAVWIISLISGILSAPEARPYIGAFMIFIAIFVFTFTYTGVMGQAVFGYWWPQVYSFGESVTAPLVPMWEQAQSGMSDSWLLLTNPMGYYDAMQKKQQSTKSVVTSGGTTKSIELTKTDLFTSVTGELEPRLDPLVGSFEIQNQGEFEANKIKLDLWASWTDATAASTTNPPIPIKTGTLDNTKFSCSQPAVNPHGTVNGGVGTCDWIETTYPQEIKVVNFMFVKKSWSLGSSGNLMNCVVKDTCGPDTGDLDTCCSNPNATYVFSGQTVKVNVNLTYDYNVNVSIPLEVINENKYRNLLQARQITLQDLTSQYTGGPVKATLWSQKQPVRENELSLFVASIVNEGGGTLNSIRNFKVLISKQLVGNEINNIQIIAQTFKKTAGVNVFDGCGDVPLDGSSFTDLVNGNNYFVINCTHAEPMKSGEYKRVSFFVTPGSVSDRKTSLLVGLANYEYIKTGSATIAVTNNPWH